jgi:hypothetical protein
MMRRLILLTLRRLIPLTLLAIAACSGAAVQAAVQRTFDGLFGFPSGTTRAIGGPSPGYDDEGVTPPEGFTAANACNADGTDSACVACVKSMCCQPSVDCLNDGGCYCQMQCRATGGSPSSCVATCAAIFKVATAEIADDGIFTAEDACVRANCGGCPGVTP